MQSAIFLDTNILIYAASGKKNEQRKWSISLDLLDHPEAILSGQVMAEFYAVSLKKKYLTDAMAAQWVETLAEMPVVEIDSRIVVEGVALARRYKISYWDAALVAACQRGGADTLYTEDLSHGQLYDGVRVVNPFKEY